MKRTVLLLALCGVVSHTLARSTFPVLLPAIEDELLDSHQQAGLLTTINFGAYLCGVALVTTISGRYEPIRVLLTGLVSAAMGFVLLSMADGFGLLGLGLALTGLGSAGIWMSVPAIATSTVPANRRGTVMGLLSSMMGLGIVTVSQGTNAFRAVRSDDQAWRPTWVAASIYAVVLIMLIAALLRPPKTARIAGGVSLTRLRTVPGWLSLIVGYWLFGAIVASFTPFFGVALEESGLSRAHVGNLYSAFGLAAVIGAVSFGRVSDRVGRRPVLLGAMLVIAASGLLVVVGREPYAAIAAVSFGVASYTFPVLVAAHLSDHLKDREFSNAFGALTLIYGTALVIGPVISGTIGDSRFGFDLVFLLVTALACVSAVFLSRLPTPVPVDDAEPAGVSG